MGKQTYENYHKEYYAKNRARIHARTKAYRKMAARRYYLENREKILLERKIKRDLLKESVKGIESTPQEGTDTKG